MTIGHAVLSEQSIIARFLHALKLRNLADKTRLTATVFRLTWNNPKIIDLEDPDNIKLKL